METPVRVIVDNPVKEPEKVTLAEEKLSQEDDGAQLIKQIRMRLVESSRLLLENIIYEKTGAKVISVHTDISTRSGERIFVLVLDMNLETELKNQL